MPQEPRHENALPKPAAPLPPNAAANGSRDLKEPVSRLSDVDFDILYTAIEQMCHLLSDPKVFAASVSKKIDEKQLPPEWKDVAGIPQNPLLRKVGDKWHWLCDINANPLQITEPASAVAGVAAMQPKAPEQGQVAFIESKIKFVEEADEAIRFYTEDRLNLEILGSDLRLLAISPTHNSFRVAASSYRASAGPGPMELTYPSLTTDKSIIEEYETKLRNSVRLMKRALFLSEFLATEKSGLNSFPGSRIRTEMVRLIAGDLDFNRHNPAEIDSLLAEFNDDFSVSDQAAKAAFQQIAHDDSPLDHNWIQQLQNELQTLWKARAESPAPLPPAISAPQDPIQIYFANRTRALIMYARNKQPLKRLCLTELIARAIFELPPFHGDPERIRLLDYADALVATKKYPNNSATAFAVALLTTLGFGKQVESQTFPLAPVLGEEMAADLAEAAKSNRRSGERALLILAGSSEVRVPVGSQTLIQQPKGEGSYAAAWTISKTHAVLPIHTGDLQTLTIFYPGVSYAVEDRLELTMEIRDENLPTAPPRTPQTLQGTLGSPAVGKPTSLDDAVALIRKNLSTAS